MAVIARATKKTFSQKALDRTNQR